MDPVKPTAAGRWDSCNQVFPASSQGADQIPRHLVTLSPSVYSEHISGLTPLPLTSSPPDIWMNSNIKDDTLQRRELGEEAHLLSSKFYPLFLFVSCLPTLPFLVPVFFWNLNEYRIRIIWMSTASFILNFGFICLFSYYIVKFRNFPMLKARGKTFTVTLLVSASLQLLSSYLTVLLYTGVFTGQFFEGDVLNMPNDMTLPNAFLMVVVRLVQTLFMGVLTGRLAVFYTLFVSRKRTKIFSAKEITWLFWRPVVFLLLLSVIVLIPYVVFTITYVINHIEWEEDVFKWSFIAAMWIMAIVRGIAFFWYAWRVKDIELIFSDYTQNYRAGVLDFFLMMASCIVWTVVGIEASSVAILQISAQIAVLSYLVDGFMIPIYLAWKHFRIPEQVYM
eukprot:CFRG8359T1